MPGALFLYCEIIQFWTEVYHIIRTEETGKVAWYLVFYNKKGLQSFKRNTFSVKMWTDKIVDIMKN